MKSQFLEAFHSTVWMTYRKGFSSMVRPSIPPAHQHTSDSGWGCMLRGGQMLLANSLICHKFGKNFSLKMLENNTENITKYLSVLIEFMDNLKGPEAAFSIGNIVEKGLKYNMMPKGWYGPSIITSILAELNSAYKPFKDFEIVTFPEGVIYQNEILQKAESGTGSAKSKWITPLLIFVAFRLGLNSIDKDSYPAVIRLLDIPQCTGMIGGQGHGALYFIGHQGSDLIFLDPHVAQTAVEKPETIWAEHLSYHYSTPLTLSIDKLDTCVSYGNHHTS